MGKSIRSKRMKRNRRAKKAKTYGPREEMMLKEALAFEPTEKTETAHLSIFHDVMNGPPPAVPGLEPGSKLAKAHLTSTHETLEKIKERNQCSSNFRLHNAKKALSIPITFYDSRPKEDDKRKKPVVDEDKMDDQVVRVYDPKTNKDQFGQYPPWMNDKKIRLAARSNRIFKQKNRRRVQKGKKPLRPKPQKDKDMSDDDME